MRACLLCRPSLADGLFSRQPSGLREVEVASDKGKFVETASATCQEVFKSENSEFCETASAACNEADSFVFCEAAAAP